MTGRVVVWLANGIGKGFALKAVVAVGALAGAAIAAVSYKLGERNEKKKRENEE